MRRITLILLLFCFATNLHAYQPRNLLQQKASLENLKSSLVLGQKWVSYPDYSNRRAWDSLTADVKAEIIAKGESYLKYDWKVVRATDFLEFERSGSQEVMAAPFGANNAALTKLVLAELTEGKGRFLDQIVNGIWYYCEMTSWAVVASIPSYQKSKRSLPDPNEKMIDLTTGDVGSFLSWCYYFFKDEFDKVDPVISRRLRDNLQTRILDTYMSESDFRWQAFDATPTTMVNNWTPWCNFNVLTCFLLLENDPDKLAAGVYRTMVSVDQFLNYNHEDGACEEGPSYWGHAAGKMYNYLQILSIATSGKISLFDQPMIKKMGEYIVRSYVGNDWVVNFADASAQSGADMGLIFRYGKAVNSLAMINFSAYLYKRSNKESYYDAGRDFYRTLETLASHQEFSNLKTATLQDTTIWYPDTEFCFVRDPSGFFLAIKGGFNAESHNHNDVGTFSLFVDQTPMIIDAGVGTYTRQTFSGERYKIWTMQSNYHNLPMINGVAQAPGREYRSRNVKFDRAKSIFSLDIAGAYPKEAAVKKWQRNYHLDSKKGLIIQDEFALSETKMPNQLNFLTWSEPDLSNPGVVTLKKDGLELKLTYDPVQFKPVKEVIELRDRKLSGVWGKQIYRLSLNALTMQLSGKYKIEIQKP
jgi:hypothetical protein